MDSYEWHCLQDASRSLLICIWVMASEGDNWKTGTIPNEPSKIAFRARKDPKEIIILIRELITNGFIEVLTDSSDLLSNCYQDDAPETETETEKEAETNTEAEKKDTNVSKKNTRGSRLPDDWELSQELGDWAVDQGFTGIEVEKQADKFKDYWKAVAGAKGVKIVS